MQWMLFKIISDINTTTPISLFYIGADTLCKYVQIARLNSNIVTVSCSICSQQEIQDLELRLEDAMLRQAAAEEQLRVLTAVSAEKEAAAAVQAMEIAGR